MGIILCKRHGKQGFEQVCKHIDADLKAEVCLKSKRLDFWGNILVCDECWKNYEIEKFEEHPELKGKDYFDIDDEFDENSYIFQEYCKVYDKLNENMGGWCLQCMAEIKIKNARRNNKPDPFRVFEKTLTHAQKDVVEKLEEELTGKFQFQKSVVWETQFQNRPAVFIQAGAFSYPLTIKIYYVIDECKQDKIIHFVEKFLQQTELSQAKIEFWEAENWIATENQFGLYNYRRGEEKLLREEMLNC
jgi:ribosomal protein S17E